MISEKHAKRFHYSNLVIKYNNGISKYTFFEVKKSSRKKYFASRYFLIELILINKIATISKSIKIQ